MDLHGNNFMNLLFRLQGLEWKKAGCRTKGRIGMKWWKSIYSWWGFPIFQSWI